MRKNNQHKRDDKNITEEKINYHHYQYDMIRKLVAETFGDSLRNLSAKRKEKIIQRGVLLWMKGSNATVLNALDAIHFPEREFIEIVADGVNLLGKE